MKHAPNRVLSVDATLENDRVLVRFRDTGPGIANPEALFQPFQPGAAATGLGLYISRTVLKSYGGDLRYEPSAHGGGSFVVQLWPADDSGNSGVQ